MMGPTTPIDVFNFMTSITDNGRRDDDGKLSIAKYLGGRTRSGPVDPRALDYSANEFLWGDTAEEQYKLNRFDNWNATQIRVNDALKAGINPLAALGVSHNVSPTMSTSKYDGGQNKQRNYLTDFMRDIIGLRKESMQLDNESKRIANDVAKEKLAHVRQPGIAGNGTAYENPNWRVPMNWNHRNAQPLYLNWSTPDGRIISLLNPDAIADADITNIEAIKALGQTPGPGLHEPYRNFVSKIPVLSDIMISLDKADAWAKRLSNRYKSWRYRK